jgi:hypothetical protein
LYALLVDYSVLILLKTIFLIVLKISSLQLKALSTMSNITANPSRAVGVFNADVCKTIQLSLTFQNMSSFDIVHFRFFFQMDCSWL